MADQDFEAIETMLAHHDRQIEDLSEMIRLQWKEIERLKFKLAEAHDKINEINSAKEDKPSSSVAEIAAAEKPPHY